MKPIRNRLFSLLLVFSLLCSCAIPVVAESPNLTVISETIISPDVDNLDHDAFAGYTTANDDSLYDNIPITTAPLPNIVHPTQYSAEIRLAYEKFCIHMNSAGISISIPIEDFYTSFCLSECTDINIFLNQCLAELPQLSQAQEQLFCSDSASSARSSSDPVENSYWYYNTGLTPPIEPTYDKYNLLSIVQKGDIIHEAGNHSVMHAAIVEGIFYSPEYAQYYIRIIESIGYISDIGQAEGVCRGILDDTRFDEREGTILRLKDTYKTDSIINSAVAFCVAQIGKPYALDFSHAYSSSEEHWHCSQLVWAAYLNQGINLENATGIIVLPNTLLDSNKLNTITSYLTIPDSETPEITSLTSNTFNGVLQVSLFWNDLIETDVTYYQIYRAPNAGGNYTLIGTTQYSYYEDKSVETDSAYCYRVKAVIGQKTTNPSKVRSVRTSFKAPVFMSINYPSGTSVFVHWSAVYSATHYKVFRSTSETGPFIETSFEGSGLTYIDEDLTHKTLYYYKIIAYRNNTKSPDSVIRNIKPLHVYTPTIYYAYSDPSQGIILKWTFVLPATMYKIYRKTAFDEDYVEIAINNMTTYIDDELPSGVNYFRYKIVAINNYYESDMSDERGASRP